MLLLCLGGSCLGAERTLVIHAGQLFDGKSDALASNQVIVVQGDRIAEVGPAATVKIPAGAEEIDLLLGLRSQLLRFLHHLVSAAYPGFALDAKLGGTYRMTFTSFSSGKGHIFGGTFVELVPHERIQIVDRFDDSNLPGEMQKTITLKKVFCGTELQIVHDGIPDAIPPEGCYLGWQESLILLAKLVEAEIPD